MSWSSVVWLQAGLSVGMSILSIWLVMFFLHKTLTHRTFTITSPWFRNLLVFLSWFTHFGSSPFQWSISHRLHHMFGDVPGLDPYSKILRGFWRILFGSAVYLHAYNRRPGHDQLFPDLALKPWEEKLFQMRRFVLVPLIILFLIFPLSFYRGSFWGGVALTGTGILAGAVPTLTALLGGGMINSLAHSWRGKIGVILRWYERRFALDGTTAANRPLWAILIPELWHLNHHDRADQGNFGWRHPVYQWDWVFGSGLALQALGLVREGFMNIPHNRPNLEAWVRTWHERGSELTDAEVTELVDRGLAALHGRLEKRQEAVFAS